MTKQVITKTSLPILTVRGQRVVMDFDLARTYGVTTGRFNEAVKRNLKRFPAYFSFVVTREEYEGLISQFAISKPGRGGRTKLPRVFTEHGALMAASILNSERAIEMSVYVIRAFVEMRETLATNAAILKRLAEIDKTLVLHGTALSDIYQKLLPLLSPAPDPGYTNYGRLKLHPLWKPLRGNPDFEKIVSDLGPHEISSSLTNSSE